MQDAHNAARVRAIHEALIDIVAVMNQPQRDEAMVREAGISLDRALFPLLVGIERRGPIGVVDLAGRVGRDYTTVSRQVAKLESLGLVARRAGADRRIREAAITPKGKQMTDAVDAARVRLARSAFADWPAHDLDAFTRLLRKFADTLTTNAPEGDGAG